MRCSMTNRPLQGPSSASPSTTMVLNGVLLGNNYGVAARVASDMMGSGISHGGGGRSWWWCGSF